MTEHSLSKKCTVSSCWLQHVQSAICTSLSATELYLIHYTLTAHATSSTTSLPAVLRKGLSWSCGRRLWQRSIPTTAPVPLMMFLMFLVLLAAPLVIITCIALWSIISCNRWQTKFAHGQFAAQAAGHKSPSRCCGSAPTASVCNAQVVAAAACRSVGTMQQLIAQAADAAVCKSCIG